MLQLETRSLFIKAVEHETKSTKYIPIFSVQDITQYAGKDFCHITFLNGNTLTLNTSAENMMDQNAELYTGKDEEPITESSSEDESNNQEF